MQVDVSCKCGDGASHCTGICDSQIVWPCAVLPADTLAHRQWCICLRFSNWVSLLVVGACLGLQRLNSHHCVEAAREATREARGLH